MGSGGRECCTARRGGGAVQALSDGTWAWAWACPGGGEVWHVVPVCAVLKVEEGGAGFRECGGALLRVSQPAFLCAYGRGRFRDSIHDGARKWKVGLESADLACNA